MSTIIRCLAESFFVVFIIHQCRRYEKSSLNWLEGRELMGHYEEQQTIADKQDGIGWRLVLVGKYEINLARQVKTKSVKYRNLNGISLPFYKASVNFAKKQGIAQILEHLALSDVVSTHLACIFCVNKDFQEYTANRTILQQLSRTSSRDTGSAKCLYSSGPPVFFHNIGEPFVIPAAWTMSIFVTMYQCLLRGPCW